MTVGVTNREAIWFFLGGVFIFSFAGNIKTTNHRETIHQGVTCSPAGTSWSRLSWICLCARNGLSWHCCSTCTCVPGGYWHIDFAVHGSTLTKTVPTSSSPTNRVRKHTGKRQTKNIYIQRVPAAPGGVWTPDGKHFKFSGDFSCYTVQANGRK